MLVCFPPVSVRERHEAELQTLQTTSDGGYAGMLQGTLQCFEIMIDE
jgi:hypothetical protein